MRQLRIIIITALLLAISTSAFAVDLDNMEYYVYGPTAFLAVSSALKKVALIFGHNEYKALFFSVMALGLFGAGAMLFTRAAIGGGKASLTPWIFQIIIGAGLYTAFIVPQGNLIVYDPVSNQHSIIGGLPKGLVFLAGITNMISTGLIEIVAESGDPKSFSNQAGLPGLVVLRSLMSLSGDDTPAPAEMPRITAADQYADTCILFESGRPGTTMTQASFFADILSAGELAASPAVFTQSAMLGSSPVTCQEAWQPLKVPPTTPELTSLMTRLCKSASYNNTVAAGKCESDVLSLMSDAGLTWESINDLRGQRAVAQGLVDAIKSHDPTGMGNYAMSSKAAGTLSQAATWLPAMKGGIIGITLAFVPLVLLVAATPAIGRALSYLSGGFIFLAAWDVADSVLFGFIYDSAVQALSANAGGLDAFLRVDDAFSQTFAMYGAMSMSGMALASGITGALFKFSSGLAGSIAAGAGGQAMQAIQTAEQRAEGAFDPQQHRQAMQGAAIGLEHSLMGASRQWMTAQAEAVKQTWGGMEDAQNYDYLTKPTSEGGAGMSKQGAAQMMRRHLSASGARAAAEAQVKQGRGGDDILQADRFAAAQQSQAGMPIQTMGQSGDWTKKGTASDGVYSLNKGDVGISLDRHGNVVSTQNFPMDLSQGGSIDSGYRQAISNSQAETAQRQSSFNEAWNKNSSKSTFWSDLQSLSDSLKTGSTTDSSLMSTVAHRLAENIDENTRINDHMATSKDKENFLAMSAGAGANLKFVHAEMSTGGRWSMRDSEGRTYSVDFGQSKHEGVSQDVAKTVRQSVSTEQARNWMAQNSSGSNSSTAFGETVNAATALTESESKTTALNRERTEALSNSSSWRISGLPNLIHTLANKETGGFEERITKAGDRLIGAANSPTEGAKILGGAAMANRPTGQGLPEVQSLKGSGAPTIEQVKTKVSGAQTTIKAGYDSTPAPTGPGNVRQQMQQQVAQQSSIPDPTAAGGSVDQFRNKQAEAQERINNGKRPIERQRDSIMPVVPAVVDAASNAGTAVVEGGKTFAKEVFPVVSGTVDKNLNKRAETIVKSGLNVSDEPQQTGKATAPASEMQHRSSGDVEAQLKG